MRLLGFLGAVAALTLGSCGSEPDEGSVFGAPDTSGTETSSIPAIPTSTEPSTTAMAGTDAPAAPAVTDPPVTSPVDRVPLCSEIERLAARVIGNVKGMENPDMVVTGAAHRYSQQHIDTFAGMWIDRDHGGTIVLAFTDAPEPHLEALLAFETSQADLPQMANPPVVLPAPLSSYPYEFDVVQAEFTEAELRETADVLVPFLQSGQWEIGGSGIDIVRNRVSVRIRYVSEDDLVALAEIVPSDSVCVEGVIGEAPVFPADTPLDVIPEAGSDPRVACGGVSFWLSALGDATPIEDLDDPAVDALLANRSSPMGELPPDGWRLLERTDDSALFVRLTDDSTGFARFDLTPGGWTAAGSGVGSACRPDVVLPEGLETVTWEIDPAFPTPQPGDTVVHVLATERGCASGEPMGDRLRGPQVVETDTEVLIAFAVVTKGGGDCPGNPSEPVAIELGSPLRDRVLRDGLRLDPLSSFPP